MDRENMNHLKDVISERLCPMLDSHLFFWSFTPPPAYIICRAHQFEFLREENQSTSRN